MFKFYNIKRNHGSVLILSLMILVVLTIIGVSSMSSSGLQGRMAGNFRDREIAFQAAETALAYAEAFANSNINSPSVFDNTNGYYAAGGGPKNSDAYTSTWWTAAKSQSYPGNISQVNTQPRFTIEYTGPIGEEEGTDGVIEGYGESQGGGAVSGFTITARGTGLSDNTQVVLQTHYGKRL